MYFQKPERIFLKPVAALNLVKVSMTNVSKKILLIEFSVAK